MLKTHTDRAEREKSTMRQIRKIVITGATGMIGSSVIRSAIRDGIEIWAIVRDSSQRLNRIPKSPLVHLLYGGLEEMPKMRDLPNDCDCFYHLGWMGTGRATRDNPSKHAPNVPFTVNAAELAAKMGCFRFVCAGSQAEYGPVHGPIDDHTPFAPVHSYGIAKYASFLLSRKICQQLGVEHVWGRIFSVYGPHDKEGTMINSSIDTWLAGEKMRFSAATQKWNYLFESDAGEMFYRLGDPNVPAGEYPIAHPEGKTLKEYIEIMAEAFGPEADFDFSGSDSMLTELNVDVSKTILATGYRPKISFENGIRQTIDEHRRKHETYGNQPGE